MKIFIAVACLTWQITLVLGGGSSWSLPSMSSSKVDCSTYSSRLLGTALNIETAQAEVSFQKIVRDNLSVRSNVYIKELTTATIKDDIDRLNVVVRQISNILRDYSWKIATETQIVQSTSEERVEIQNYLSIYCPSVSSSASSNSSTDPCSILKTAIETAKKNVKKYQTDVKVQNKVLLEYERLFAEFSEMAGEATIKCDIEAYEQLASDFLEDIERTKKIVLTKQSLLESAQNTLSETQSRYTIECPW